MGALYVNAEKLKELDFTGKEMQQMRDEAADCYNLSYYKGKVAEYMASLDATERTIEETIAELVKMFYLDGYMDAVSELTDRYSEIISAATNRKTA